jgi:hypothetical protein
MLMEKFNRGEPFHGSELISNGKLTGTTDTDYFYFFFCQLPHPLFFLNFELKKR